MSSGNAAWIGRKGRTDPRTHNKQVAFGNSNLICELNSIVESFTAEQRKIAESPKPIHAVQFDRQFNTWLMAKVDTMSRSIGPNAGRKLMIFQEDAAKVFGIPCTGKEVWDVSLDKSQSLRKKVEEIIGMDDQTALPSVAAERTLRSLAGRELSAEEATQLKVSFVVSVVSMLVDSKTPDEQESQNFWPAFTSIEDIHTLNWASYILDSLTGQIRAPTSGEHPGAPPSPAGEHLSAPPSPAGEQPCAPQPPLSSIPALRLPHPQRAGVLISSASPRPHIEQKRLPLSFRCRPRPLLPPARILIAMQPARVSCTIQQAIGPSTAGPLHAAGGNRAPPARLPP
ncbi:hypothetical protein ACQ4PT_032140 [Festuca glaucescens]